MILGSGEVPYIAYEADRMGGIRPI